MTGGLGLIRGIGWGSKPLQRNGAYAAGAQVAQLVEHATENRSVGGSTPSLGTISFLQISDVQLARNLLKYGLAALVLTTSLEAAAQTARRIRGTVEQLDGNTLIVQSRQGEALRIALAPNFTVGALSKGDLSAVQPGAYVGIVSTGPRDRMRAAVVTVFPEGASRANEGQSAWDTLPNSMMTNAPVESEVTGKNGRELTVSVKGEKLAVQVPPDAIIAVTSAGTPAMVTPGSKVIIFAQAAADGTLSAARVNVGRDGFTPPM